MHRQLVKSCLSVFQTSVCPSTHLKSWNTQHFFTYNCEKMLGYLHYIKITMQKLKTIYLDEKSNRKDKRIETISPRFLPARYLVVELKGCIETCAVSVYLDSNQYTLFTFHFSSLELLFGSGS